MATPIKSSNVNGTSANGVTNSPAMSDLMNRLGAQPGNTDAQSQQLAFSRWLEKHAIVSDGASAKAPQAAVTQQPPAGTSEASRAAEQALARARQQAAANKNKAMDKPVTHAEAQTTDKSAKPKTDAPQAKPVRKDATAKASSTDKSDKSAKTEDKDKTKDKDDEVSFNTAMGDGSAVVRELTPPSSIQPGDSAGMMAWLASLTHGDLTQGKTQTALQQDDSGAQGGNGAAATDDKLTDLLHAGKRAGESGPGIALDSALWQTSGSTAQQAEAMMAQLGKASEGRAEGDPLAGLVSGGALKGATFGEIMNNATQNVRHESATLDVPFGSTDFAQALAEKVSMWVGATQPDGSMTAELHLNPADMGPINVKISLDGQTAHVDFAAAALETRQAIEASLPMLSSALSDVGLSMTGGDVSSQTSQQQAFNQAAQGDGGSGRAGAVGRIGEGDDVDTAVGMRAVSAPRPGRAGGLDLYA